jgi:hypothetical protein
MIATIVETQDLLDVVWTSAAAGVGVTLAYAAMILGMGRAVDYGRAGRPLEAVAYGVLGLVSLAIVGGAIVLGIVVMVHK